MKVYFLHTFFLFQLKNVENTKVYLRFLFISDWCYIKLDIKTKNSDFSNFGCNSKILLAKS